MRYRKLFIHHLYWVYKLHYVVSCRQDCRPRLISVTASTSFLWINWLAPSVVWSTLVGCHLACWWEEMVEPLDSLQSHLQPGLACKISPGQPTSPLTQGQESQEPLWQDKNSFWPISAPFQLLLHCSVNVHNSWVGWSPFCFLVEVPVIQ